MVENEVRHEKPSNLSGEGEELLVGGNELVILCRALHNLLVRFGLGD